MRLTSEKRLKSQGAMKALEKAGPPQILFPPAEAELWAGPVNGRAPRGFVLAGRGDGQLTWYIDGEPCDTDDAGAPVWAPDKPGFYTVTAVDTAGRSSRVRVRVLTGPA